MSESQDSSKEQPSRSQQLLDSDTHDGQEQKGQATSDNDQNRSQSEHLYVVQPSSERLPSTPLFAEPRVSGSNAPTWLRPFFSMRAQLTFVCFLIVCMVAIIVCMLNYQHISQPLLSLIVIGVIAVGTLLAFLFTSLLLQPLWRVTDAAQAIALGDLEQRERLPLRLPPQDEVDRLAGSLNEMVTRLEHAEKTQQSTEQRFKRFFSDASHQLRTPLTSLRGFTEILMRGAKDDPATAQRILKLMKSEAERMTSLINDLLILSRLDDNSAIKLQYVDMLALTTEEIEKAKLRAEDNRAFSLSILTESRLELQGDTERLRQLLFVLLDNAIKYGRPAPDGCIKVQLDRQDGQVIVRVIDNGEGIAQENLGRIFDPFYRIQHKKTIASNGSNGVGTGIGLTIAVAIVHAHQGTISVYSEPGKNTTFTVSLPC